jgi:Na+-transporting NADH:ubiquinone oxidoreductase subunit B
MTRAAASTTPGLDRSRTVTPHAPHVRDAVNLQALSNWVVLALLPVLVMALIETGRQANLATTHLDTASDAGWRVALLDAIGVGHDPDRRLGSMLHGLLVFLPIYAVSLLTGGFWQALFARSRRTSAPGLMGTALLFSLAMPPAIALWQVAAGMTFGIVVGQEIFGGTGKNFLHPALTGLAFLYFAYPDALSTPATELSAPACAIGAALLLYTRAISWRILAGGVVGVTASALLFQHFAPSMPFAEMPWHWHLTAGGFAFGLVFFATDPVTAATTNLGRWVYSGFIGCLSVMIRIATSHTQEVMLAILLGNIVAPLVDYGVMWTNIRRRRRRGGYV